MFTASVSDDTYAFCKIFTESMYGILELMQIIKCVECNIYIEYVELNGMFRILDNKVPSKEWNIRFIVKKGKQIKYLE